MDRFSLRRVLGSAAVRNLVALALVALVTVQVPVGASAQEEARPRERQRPSSPQLIDRAMDAGRLDRATGYRYLAYALTNPRRLPAAYRSSTPYHGTAWILELQKGLAAMPDGPAKSRIAALVPDPASRCFTSNTPLPDQMSTAHFYIEYSAAAIGGASGLTITDYAAALETTWQNEIIDFEWAAPPVGPNPAPGNLYPVRIDPMVTFPLYGFVSNNGKYTGNAGDNPNTPGWVEPDAYATCMGLNNDYTGFPGTPLTAMQATVAHEFNHSIQFGYGAITGNNAPDIAFVEGGATWMEDEAMDSSNDNYNYLWPEFNDDMGEHEGNEYSYWITFRGLTERYGASVAGGGEDVMQRFWELTSQSATSNQLVALNNALVEHGTTLADAYHAYAIAVKFNRACGAGYSYPHCFEEGPQYVSGDGTQPGAGNPPVDGTISTTNGSFNGSMEDNYELQWVALPTSAPYSVTLTNTAAANQGALRATVVCDTGTGFVMAALPAVVVGGQNTVLATFNPAGCLSVVAVVTNEKQTAPNPGNTTARTYTLSTGVGALCPGLEAVLGSHVVGTSGDDTLTGTPSNDVMCGLGGNDSLDGLGGNDFISGGDDNDGLVGGDGVDRLAPGLGDDTVDGGTGTGPANTGDTVTYYDITGEVGVTVNLTLAAGQNTVSAGTDTISGVESITGSKQHDDLTGNGGVNYLTGGLGEDSLSGGGGNDVLQGLHEDDTVDGGEGIDTASFKASPAGTSMNLDPFDRGPAPVIAQDGWGDQDTLISIESISGSDAGGDNISGSDVNEFLYGQGGDDTLAGGGGNDYLVGGPGTDDLYGDTGSDTCRSGETNTDCESVSARGPVAYPWMFNSERAFLEAVSRSAG